MSGTNSECSSSSDSNNQAYPYGCSNIDNTTLFMTANDRNKTLIGQAANLVNNPAIVETNSRNKTLSKINRRSNRIQHANELLQLSADQNNKDLEKIKEFETEIATKKRMINIAQDGHLRRIEKIKSIIVLFIILCIIFLPLALMLGNVISKTTFIIFFVLICIVAFLVFSWMNNLFYIRDYFSFTKSSISNASAATASQLSSWEESVSNAVSSRVKSFNDTVINDVYGSEAEWIQQNCNCPSTTTTSEDTFPIPFSTSGELIWPEPGFYYDDGTAPNQLLVPKNTSARSEFQFKEKIKWPSYSRKFKNYNNSITKRRPPIDEEDDRLVGSTTNTRNL